MKYNKFVLKKHGLLQRVPQRHNLFLFFYKEYKTGGENSGGADYE